jgi:hypothetical protein
MDELRTAVLNGWWRVGRPGDLAAELRGRAEAIRFRRLIRSRLGPEPAGSSLGLVGEWREGRFWSAVTLRFPEGGEAIRAYCGLAVAFSEGLARRPGVGAVETDLAARLEARTLDEDGLELVGAAVCG